MAGRKAKYHFSYGLAAAICSLIAQGVPIDSLVREPGIPSRWVIDKWRLRHPKFNQMVLDARAERAQYFHELFVEEQFKRLEGGYSKRRAGYYAWMAKFNCSGAFGKNRNHYGWTLDTGVSIIKYHPRRKLKREVVRKFQLQAE